MHLLFLSDVQPINVVLVVVIVIMVLALFFLCPVTFHDGSRIVKRTYRFALSSIVPSTIVPGYDWFTDPGLASPVTVKKVPLLTSLHFYGKKKTEE